MGATYKHNLFSLGQGESHQVKLNGGTCFVRGWNLAEDKDLKIVQDQMTQCMSGFIEVGRLWQVTWPMAVRHL